jgi:LPPG:FO 2-phospho-L-lactate transferase
MAAVERLGGPAWFKLGDRDLATHIMRTQALSEGRNLSEVTGLLARGLGITHSISPMSDNTVRSIVQTDEGALAFQDYFVKRQCKPVFHGVTFDGVAEATPSAGFREALERAHAIVITPSNPFVSIDPILALPGVKQALRKPGRPVVAVSPIVGGKAIKGPLAKMMGELGIEPSVLGVVRHYADLVDGWVIDEMDRALAPAIEALGRRVKVCNTIMRTLDDKRGLAQDAVNFALALAGEPVS